MEHETSLDVLIVGGGGAGLWLLDELRRAGYHVLLVETNGLGHGQTIGCQGIIHGGLKYALSGVLNASADAIKDMPLIWRDCLAGTREPDLRATRLRAPCCALWQTDRFASKIGMLGAKLSLRVTPRPMPDAERPIALRECGGETLWMDEQVIDPSSFLQTLADRNRNHLVHIRTLECVFSHHGLVDSVRVTSPDGMRMATLRPRQIVLAAGEGNEALREGCGLSASAMQRRPVQMIAAKGQLPALNGHCVDGAKTRVTITSQPCADGQTVWQIGGKISEDGVDMPPEQLMALARRELALVLPGFSLPEMAMMTYRVNKAEGTTPDGSRPEDVVIPKEGNVITAWPTKLAFAPRLAERVIALLHSPSVSSPTPVALEDWPRPEVARFPWE